MKSQENNKSNQPTDSKENTKTIQDNQKKQPVTEPVSKGKLNEVQQNHQPLVAAPSAQNKKMSDRTDAEHDVKAKDKTPGAAVLITEGPVSKDKKTSQPEENLAQNKKVENTSPKVEDSGNAYKKKVK